MSAQELMKKHYIIQQKVFREKNDRPLPEPSNSEGASQPCAQTRLFVNGGRSSGWAIGSFRRPVKGVSSAIRSKHGRLLGDSFSHTARQRRFISEPSPEPSSSHTKVAAGESPTTCHVRKRIAGV